MADITLDENARWYVRSMVFRGMQSIESDIAEGRKYLEGDQVPATFRASIEGMIAYQEQLLREAKQYIPENLL